LYQTFGGRKSRWKACGQSSFQGVPLIGFYLLPDEISVIVFGIIVGFCWPPTT